MTLEDRLSAGPASGVNQTPRRGKPESPKGFEPGVKYEPNAWLVTTPPIADILEDETSWRTAVESLGLTIPDGWRVRVKEMSFDPAAWHRDAPGEDAVTRAVWRYKFAVEPDPAAVEDGYDLPSLFAEARRQRRKSKDPVAQPERAVVAVWSDAQVGKVGSRGGTPELIARVSEKLGKLDDYCADVKADVAYLLDAGDTVESFENTAQQAHTNDLSLPRQIEVAADLEFEAINLLAKRHSRVVVAGVGSNHCQWRKGKDVLGKPSDDWGIHILRQIDKAMKLNPAAFGHVSVCWPGDWDETLSLDVCGTIVGLAHGHRTSSPDQIPLWWAKQTHGGQPLAHADILVTGHYHHLRVQATGRSAFADKAKWWFQSPTLDNSSDWYRAKNGDDSDPGLMVFEVSKAGWSNLQIL